MKPILCFSKKFHNKNSFTFISIYATVVKYIYNQLETNKIS